MSPACLHAYVCVCAPVCIVMRVQVLACMHAYVCVCVVADILMHMKAATLHNARFCTYIIWAGSIIRMHTCMHMHIKIHSFIFTDYIHPCTQTCTCTALHQRSTGAVYREVCLRFSRRAYSSARRHQRRPLHNVNKVCFKVAQTDRHGLGSAVCVSTG